MKEAVDSLQAASGGYQVGRVEWISYRVAVDVRVGEAKKQSEEAVESVGSVSSVRYCTWNWPIDMKWAACCKFVLLRLMGWKLAQIDINIYFQSLQGFRATFRGHFGLELSPGLRFWMLWKTAPARKTHRSMQTVRASKALKSRRNPLPTSFGLLKHGVLIRTLCLWAHWKLSSFIGHLR